MRDTKKKLEKVLELYINNRVDEAESLLHEAFIDKARNIHESMQAKNFIAESGVGNDVTFAALAAAPFVIPMLALAIADEISRFFSKNKDKDLEEDVGSAKSKEIFDEICKLLACSTDTNEDELIRMIHDKFLNMSKESQARLFELTTQLAAAQGDVDEFVQDLEHAAETPEQHQAAEELGKIIHGQAETGMMEDYHDMMEALDLDVLRSDLYAGGDQDREVGSGKFSKPNTSRASPVASSQHARMGAKPVVMGRGPHARNFDRDDTSKYHDRDVTGTRDSNRRKKATDGMDNMSSGNYGAKKVTHSKLETTQDEFKTDKSKSPFYDIKLDD